jgi:hypothetical protein
MPELLELDPGDGDRHLVLTTDWGPPHPQWLPGRLATGTHLPEPLPLFRKLGPEVAEAEVERMAHRRADREAGHGEG